MQSAPRNGQLRSQVVEQQLEKSGWLYSLPSREMLGFTAGASWDEQFQEDPAGPMKAVTFSVHRKGLQKARPCQLLERRKFEVRPSGSSCKGQGSRCRVQLLPGRSWSLGFFTGVSQGWRGGRGGWRVTTGRKYPQVWKYGHAFRGLGTAYPISCLPHASQLLGQPSGSSWKS